jgi:hypothetical protein
MRSRLLSSAPVTDPAADGPARSRRRGRPLSAALTLLLVAASLLGITAPASAAPTVVTCTGNQTITYSPGLTNTPTVQTSQVSTAYSVCAHVDGLSVSTMTGSSRVTFSGASLTCAALLDTVPGQQVVTWSDGRTSTFTYSLTATNVSGELVATATGTISAGLYAGAIAEQVSTSVGLNGLTACGTPQGLTSISGLVQLVITGV